jgi:hypothetical protein
MREPAWSSDVFVTWPVSIEDRRVLGAVRVGDAEWIYAGSGCSVST